MLSNGEREREREREIGDRKTINETKQLLIDAVCQHSASQSVNKQMENTKTACSRNHQWPTLANVNYYYYYYYY